MPCEESRMPLLRNTLATYSSFLKEKEGQSFFPDTELLIISRSITDPTEIKEISPFVVTKVINYTYIGDTFNPAMAFNIGVRNAYYHNILITCPEVKPLTDILEQLKPLYYKNVMCQVFDEYSPGGTTYSLVNSNFRINTPAMYFMAMFTKEAIYKINGWDEDFMKGYAFEDTDFGNRWVMEGIPFEMHNEIQGLHQWHKRGEGCGEAWDRNMILSQNNQKNGVIRPKNGLEKLV